MTHAFKPYADAAGVTDWSAAIPIPQTAGGSSVDWQFWIMDKTTVGVDWGAASSPGLDPIALGIDDTASGSGVEASMIKLATSAVGLDSATAGVSLTLGTALTTGAANAIEVWVRIDAGSLSASFDPYDDVRLTLPALVPLA